jgi:hypothetical protein
MGRPLVPLPSPGLPPTARRPPRSRPPVAGEHERPARERQAEGEQGGARDQLPRPSATGRRSVEKARTDDTRSQRRQEDVEPRRRRQRRKPTSRPGHRSSASA